MCLCVIFLYVRSRATIRIDSLTLDPLRCLCVCVRELHAFLVAGSDGLNGSSSVAALRIFAAVEFLGAVCVERIVTV